MLRIGKPPMLIARGADAGMTTTASFGIRKKVRKGADMKNLTPGGYQGFPALFNGLFGGVAMLFRRFVRRRASAGEVEQKQNESAELKPISSSTVEPDSKPRK